MRVWCDLHAPAPASGSCRAHHHTDVTQTSAAARRLLALLRARHPQLAAGCAGAPRQHLRSFRSTPAAGPQRAPPAAGWLLPSRVCGAARTTVCGGDGCLCAAALRHSGPCSCHPTLPAPRQHRPAAAAKLTMVNRRRQSKREVAAEMTHNHTLSPTMAKAGAAPAWNLDSVACGGVDGGWGCSGHVRSCAAHSNRRCSRQPAASAAAARAHVLTQQPPCPAGHHLLVAASHLSGRIWDGQLLVLDSVQHRPAAKRALASCRTPDSVASAQVRVGCTLRTLLPEHHGPMGWCGCGERC